MFIPNQLMMNFNNPAQSNGAHTPIGVFDSGYGGLTVFREMEALLPQYDYLYLGDNARAPYGPRSFETVYAYTLQAVEWLFAQGCPLVILACNTASAKALRSIQQKDLPQSIDPTRRVLGVIRPTAEVIGRFSKTRQIGVLGTAGTIKSESYPIEVAKFWPGLAVFQQACPLWVPLIENNEHNSPGADYFVEACIGGLMKQAANIDTILLGCTHYPLLLPKIKQFLPESVRVLTQGAIVADSLHDYLLRHPEMADRITKNQSRLFFTTDSATDFEQHATSFLGRSIQASIVHL